MKLYYCDKCYFTIERRIQTLRKRGGGWGSSRPSDKGGWARKTLSLGPPGLVLIEK